MKWFVPLILTSLTAALGWSVPAAGVTLRCGNLLVQTGASQYEVLRKCGEPVYRDSFRHVVVPGALPQAEETLWYYDFGPNRLISVLHFREGTLTQITNAGYGFDSPASRNCEPNQIQVGMTVYELLQTCGEPQYRNTKTQVWRPAKTGGYGFYETIRIDEWTYDFGSNQFPRIVEISAGIVRAVRNGGRL